MAFSRRIRTGTMDYGLWKGHIASAKNKRSMLRTLETHYHIPATRVACQTRACEGQRSSRTYPRSSPIAVLQTVVVQTFSSLGNRYRGAHVSRNQHRRSTRKALWGHGTGGMSTKALAEPCLTMVHRELIVAMSRDGISEIPC